MVSPSLQDKHKEKRAKDEDSRKDKPGDRNGQRMRRGLRLMRRGGRIGWGFWAFQDL